MQIGTESGLWQDLVASLIQVMNLELKFVSKDIACDFSISTTHCLAPSGALAEAADVG